jgi:hypothetical protein
MSQLSCPGCGAPYRAANVDLALRVAACEACGQVHDLTTRTTLQRHAQPDGDGIVVAEGRLELPWRTVGNLVGLGIFCLAWNGILAAMFVVALADGEIGVLLFGSVHGAIGVGLAYLWLATAVNRTTVTVGPAVGVAHGPLPWWGSRAVDRQDVHQVYVLEDVGSKGHRSWSVHARLNNGHPVRLLHGLQSPGRARFVEQWLERALGIADQEVAGELP